MIPGIYYLFHFDTNFFTDLLEGQDKCMAFLDLIFFVTSEVKKVGLNPYLAKTWIRNPDSQKANNPEECKNQWEGRHAYREC
jgi:hypothetical protein